MISILPKQTYIGLTIDFLEDGSQKISYVSLIKKNRSLEIVESKADVPDLKSMSAFFKNNPTIFLSINGKGIIHKRVEKELITDDIQQTNLVSYVLPNVDSKDFYGQYNEQDGFVFISVCRNNLIEALLMQLADCNCFPSELLLGPFAIETIIEFINPDAEINIYSQQLIFKEKKLISVERIENGKHEQYNIEGECINAGLLLAYSTAILCSLNNEKNINKIIEIEDNRNTIQYKLKFKKYLSIALGVLCGLLLVNFLVFSYLFEKTESSSSISSSGEQENRNRIKALTDYQNKKEFILQKNWDNKVHIANYIEDISSSSQDGLKLMSFGYQKLNSKKSRLEKTFVFDYSVIEVNGTVQNSEQLNRWMKNLDGFSYIKDIKLLDYKKNVNGNTYLFNLKILLNE